MADLSDRGQILLIAAFTLAVTFVALALVVNSAIFTENLASRGEVSGSSEALVYQHQVRQSVGAAMAFANLYNETDLVGSIEESVSDIGVNGGTQQARGGQLVNVSFDSHTPGKRIAFNASGGAMFQSQGGLNDWQLAEDVDETRNIEINVTRKGALDTPSGSPFTLVANESDTSGNIWTMEVSLDGSDAVVEVQNAGAASSERCRTDVFGVTQFEIDVSRGLVNGTRCEALTRIGPNGDKMWFATGIPSSSSYNISFENGQNIEGNFSMVTRGGTMNGTTLITGNDPDDPFHTDALYSTTVNYVFVRPNVIYEAEIEVAPGEHP